MTKTNKIVVFIIAVLLLCVLLFCVNKKKLQNENTGTNDTQTEERAVEIDEYQIEPIDSIYYIDPNYNPRFPDETDI